MSNCFAPPPDDGFSVLDALRQRNEKLLQELSRRRASHSDMAHRLDESLALVARLNALLGRERSSARRGARVLEIMAVRMPVTLAMMFAEVDAATTED